MSDDLKTDDERLERDNSVTNGPAEIVDAEVIPDEEVVDGETGHAAEEVRIEPVDPALEVGETIDDDAESPQLAPVDNPLAFLQSLEPNIPAGQRRCPMCRELIKTSAIKCRFCGCSVDEIPDTAVSTTSGVGMKIGERQWLDQFRAGINRVAQISSLMLILNLVIAFFQDNPLLMAIYFGFAILWSFCTYFATKRHFWPAYVVVVVCSFNIVAGLLYGLANDQSSMIWHVGLLNGLMIWAGVSTISAGRKLRQRGIDLKRRY